MPLLFNAIPNVTSDIAKALRENKGDDIFSDKRFQRGFNSSLNVLDMARKSAKENDGLANLKPEDMNKIGLSRNRLLSGLLSSMYNASPLYRVDREEIMGGDKGTVLLS